MGEWQPIETAPKTGCILLLLGETIPDRPDIRVGEFIAPDEALEMGYREYSRFGGWMIWNDAHDWFVVGASAPLGWAITPTKDESNER